MNVRTVGAALCALALAPLVSCSMDAGPRATTTAPTTAPSTTAAVPTLPGETSGGTDVGSTGVPGLDDPDAYCAAWASYSGTLQAIGVAQAFGGLTSLEVARIEVVAAAALVASVDAIGRNWPADMLEERSVVLSDLVGPYGRRAQKALTMLLDAGATELDLEQFQKVWDDALHDRQMDEPVVDLPPLSSELEDLVAPVSKLFDSQVTPFGQDPSLDVHTVSAPATKAYLAATCPDLAAIGVGDAV